MRMLFLSRSYLLVLKFPPFMLDVLEIVDFLAESPKCVCTRNKQVPETLARNRVNHIVRSDKPDNPISSIPVVVRGTIGSVEGVLLPAKWCMTSGRDKIHDSCGGD
jgi:hypothetical protein